MSTDLIRVRDLFSSQQANASSLRMEEKKSHI